MRALLLGAIVLLTTGCVSYGYTADKQRYSYMNKEVCQSALEAGQVERCEVDWWPHVDSFGSLLSGLLNFAPRPR